MDIRFALIIINKRNKAKEKDLLHSSKPAFVFSMKIERNIILH